jgi:hypothetical protein
MKTRLALVASISTAGVAYLLTGYLHLLSLETAAILFVFNFLFLSFLFELNGTLRKKLGLLVLGNLMGLAWNCLLAIIADFGGSYSGDIFIICFRILFPLLNSIWVVSFWSLSLSVLPRLKLEHAEGIT